MKKVIFPLLIIILFASSCKKTSTGGAGNNCNIVSDFTITQNLDEFKFNISTSGTPVSYEVSIVWPQTSPVTGDAGDIKALGATSTTLPFSQISPNLAGQTINVFVRALCSANEKTAWIGPKTIAVSDYCGRPRNINYGLYLTWDPNENYNSNSYQVQYGEKDFALGSGTIVTTNNTNYDGASMHANTYYDFYVRSTCSGSLGMSNWAGPYTYYSAGDLNLCNAPSNVQWTIERNGSGQAVAANFTWDHNGESYFEYVTVFPWQNVTDGTISTIGPGYTPTVLVSQNTDYHFYVRGACLSGSKTSWTGPITFNIGF